MTWHVWYNNSYKPTPYVVESYGPYPHPKFPLTFRSESEAQAVCRALNNPIQPPYCTTPPESSGEVFDPEDWPFA